MRWPLILAVLAHRAIAHLLNDFQRRQDSSEFDWTSVEPSTRLEYHDCYDIARCARLLLPLDWTKANDSDSADADGNSVALAIMTLPATVPTTDETFGGSVIINLGGPGGRTMHPAYLSMAQHYQDVLDGDKHFEILLFDPRGVGMSTPAALCYKTPWAREADRIRASGMAPLSSGEAGLNHHFQAALGLGELCAQGGPEDIKAHLSSTSAARDLIAITERAAEARQGGNSSAIALLEDEKPRVQFIGTSYGTFIGNIFVSLFPHRAGRMLFDAVVHPEEATRGGRLMALFDVEEILDVMYEDCFQSNCTFRVNSDSSAQDLRKRVDDFMAELRLNPEHFVQNGRVHLITAEMVSLRIQSMTYSAPINVPIFSSLLYQMIIEGDFSVLTRGDQETACEDAKDPDESTPPRDYFTRDDSFIAISCADSYSGIRNISWAKHVVDITTAQSPTTGPALAEAAIQCAGWRIEPPYRFSGPFISPEADPENPDTPSAPILIVSARLDNVTPLRGAAAITHDHPGSSLVIQEGALHGVSGLPSECLRDIVKSYFNEGKLPENGTICEEPEWASINSARDEESMLRIKILNQGMRGPRW